MSMQSRVVWMDGSLIEYERATVHFMTPALHDGAAVFEDIRSYATDDGPAVFRVREHADRLLQSARIFGFRQLPYSAGNVHDVVRGSHPRSAQWLSPVGRETAYGHPVRIA